MTRNRKPKSNKSQRNTKAKATPISEQRRPTRMVNPALRETMQNNIRIVRECSNSLYKDVSKIMNGYQKLGGDDDLFERLTEVRHEARDARRWHPFVLRGAESIIDWTYSRVPDLEEITTNDSLQEFINGILNSPFTTAFNLIENAEHELVDGEMIVRFITAVTGDGEEAGATISIVDAPVDEYNRFESYVNPLDVNTIWLHQRRYKTLNDKGEYVDRITYYPDCMFWPSAGLRTSLENKLRNKDESSGITSNVDWTIRIMRTELNGGVPLVSPSIVYAQCLDKIITMQTAVLNSIASMATYYQVEDVDEREQAIDAFQRMDRTVHGTDYDDGYDANTIVGSGKISALNLNVAMLQESAAIYKLLHAMVYNSFPGLRPQDWAETESGGLNSANNKNEKAFVSGKRRQGRFANFYTEVLECAAIYAISEADMAIDGVTTVSSAYSIEDGAIEVRQLQYSDMDERITIQWPEIQLSDMEQTINSYVQAVTMGGTLAVPVGTPQDLANVMQSVGLNANIEAETWEELGSDEAGATEAMRQLATRVKKLQQTAESLQAVEVE